MPLGTTNDEVESGNGSIMPTSDDDAIIVGRLSTRESSTLTFATVASSASLVLLGLDIEHNAPIPYPWLNYIGVAFVILGIVYREVTHWTVDRLEYRKLSPRLRKKLKRPSAWQKRFTLIRRFVVRLSLYLPILAWVGYFSIGLPYGLVIVGSATSIAFALSYIPSLTRYDIDS